MVDLLVLVTNSAPRLPADDPAVWARVRRVPWTVVVPEAEQDPELPKKMRQAADALLAWMLAGLADYQAHGLSEPVSVQRATDEYKADQDTVALFLADRCEKCDFSDGDGTKTLHMEYRGFCRGNGVMTEHMLGERDFGSRLDDLGYPSTKGSGGRRFRAGLRLAPDNDQSQDMVRLLTQPAQVEAGPNHLIGGSSADFCTEHTWHEGQLCVPDWCHTGHFGKCNSGPSEHPDKH